MKPLFLVGVFYSLVCICHRLPGDAVSIDVHSGSRRTQFCYITTSLEGSSPRHEYICQNDSASAVSPRVTVHVFKGDKGVVITCMMRNEQERQPLQEEPLQQPEQPLQLPKRQLQQPEQLTQQTTATGDASERNDDWLPLLVGVNFSASYERLTISSCRLPTESFKSQVLEALHIAEIKILCLEFIPNSRTLFGGRNDSYLGGLDALLELQLSHNAIVEMSPSALHGLPKLDTLFLNMNALRNLNGDLFKPVSSTLRFLQLGCNSLTYLDDRLFEHLPNLAYLFANSNNLSASSPLGRSVFSRTPKLKILDLHNSHIGSLDDDLFRDLRSLENINLSFNEIGRLPGGIFADCASLKEIRAINFTGSGADANLPSALFANLSSLVQVELIANRLSALPEDLFRKTYNLKTAFLNRNKLVSLPASIFRDNQNLELLDLSYNRLTDLNDNVFQGLEKLATLHLQNNRIDSIKK